MPQRKDKKHFAIGEDEEFRPQDAEQHAYSVQYLRSECRPVKELQPLWKAHKKFHKLSTFEAWIAERDRCRKDNYWLGKEWLGHDFVPHVHQEMCDAFVKKNFDGVYHAGYTLKEVRDAIGRQIREREMLMLTPRGAFKSTTNCVDSVSWLLNCPDGRVLIISGEATLAEKFMMTVKGYFFQPDGADPSRFQALFPEYILKGDLRIGTLSQQPLTCPARMIPQEGQPSLWVNSMGSNLSGWHCDVLKGDDTVTDENSNTDATRAKVKKKWDGAAANLCDQWGFVDDIGTRYFPYDKYGERLKLMDVDPFVYLKRAAWTVKPEFSEVPMLELKEHMVDLYFPEKITYKSVMSALRRDYVQCMCQQFNEPVGGEDLVHFDEVVMRAHHLSGEPADLANRPAYIAWDCSSGHATGDFSCGAVGKISDRGELYVVDLDYGKWKQSELAIHIVKLAAKHKPQFIIIEDFAWSELLKKEINFHAQYMGVTLPIYWKKTDKSMNAKKNRIKGLEGLLAEERLFFLSGFYTDELMKQFTRFTGERRIRNRHDDIPDAISYLQQFVPDMVTGEVDAPIVDPTLHEITEMGKAVAPDRKQFEQQTVARVMHRTGEASPFFNPNFADEWTNRNAGTKNAFGLSQPEPVVEEVSSGNPIDDRFFGGAGIYR